MIECVFVKYVCFEDQHGWCVCDQKYGMSILIVSPPYRCTEKCDSGNSVEPSLNWSVLAGSGGC